MELDGHGGRVAKFSCEKKPHCFPEANGIFSQRWFVSRSVASPATVIVEPFFFILPSSGLFRWKGVAPTSFLTRKRGTGTAGEEETLVAADQPAVRRGPGALGKWGRCNCWGPFTNQQLQCGLSQHGPCASHACPLSAPPVSTAATTGHPLTPAGALTHSPLFGDGVHPPGRPYAGPVSDHQQAALYRGHERPPPPAASCLHLLPSRGPCGSPWLVSLTL